MKTDVYEEKAANQQSNTRQSENKSGQGDSQADKEEMMKRMQAAGTPGAGHQALNALVGNWKAEVKCYMNPDGPANISHGTSKTSWILGGRFLQEEFHGEMMGRPFTGRALLGFDNTTQKFKNVWVDDVNTAMTTTEGTGENGNKVITLEGKVNCPGTGEKDISMKQVFRVLSADKIVLEMSHDGTTKMEITYTRQ